MWRKEDGSSPQSADNVVTSPAQPKAAPVQPGVSPKAAACVSQGIRIKGELSGSEDLFIDGTVDGKINLANATLTVGPNATVKADITARELVLRGRAEGKFEASERIQIWSSARVEAELKAQRISIEDGAELRGKVEAGKPGTALAAAAGASKKGSAKGKEEIAPEAQTSDAVAGGTN